MAVNAIKRLGENLGEKLLDKAIRSDRFVGVFNGIGQFTLYPAVGRINRRIFDPLKKIPHMNFHHCAKGGPQTVSVLLGCRSISESVVDDFVQTYRQGDKVIVSGGVPVKEEYVGHLLASSGKKEEAYDDIGAKTLKERFTSELCEAEYMKQRLLQKGVREDDIIFVDDQSKNTGEQIQNVKKTIVDHGFKGAVLYIFSASAMRAFMTARHEADNPELNDVTISVEPVNAFGYDPKNWHKAPWLYFNLKPEYTKIGPEGTSGSYVGKHCSEIDVAAEAARISAFNKEF